MEEKKLYTVFLDYDGGTYVSQIQSESLQSALQTWLQEQCPHIDGISTMQVELSDDELRNLSFDALTDMSGVWCTSVTVGRKLALFHFVLSEYSKCASSNQSRSEPSS